MIHTVYAVRTLRAVAMAVGLALLLWSTGLPTLFRTAEAGSITDASDTISNSAPSVAANHTIVFTTGNGLSTGQSFTITFDGNFVMGSVGEDDIDLDINGVATATAAAAGAGVWGVGVAGSVITFDTPTDMGAASSSILTIRIGTNAVDSGTGVNQITNPSATTSYPITIGGSMQDSGTLSVAIIDSVTVSASVNASIEFTVYGVASGATVNSSPTTTSADTTSITLPFGTLDIGVSETLAQDLTVVTNAFNGYVVTVQQSTPLQSTTGGVIDGFINGSNTQTPSAWVGPSAILADPATYGHWGITSDDTSIVPRASQFSADTWVSASSTAAIPVMGHTGPADGTGSSGSARIGYQVEISALQEAGDDYSTTLRYVATPTF